MRTNDKEYHKNVHAKHRDDCFDKPLSTYRWIIIFRGHRRSSNDTQSKRNNEKEYRVHNVHCHYYSLLISIISSYFEGRKLGIKLELIKIECNGKRLCIVMGDGIVV